MTERYDHGGTGWGVGPELSAQRLVLDGAEAQALFLLLAEIAHGKKFDYGDTKFRSFKHPIRVRQGQDEFETLPYLHLIDRVGGGRFGQSGREFGRDFAENLRVARRPAKPAPPDKPRGR